MLHPPRNLLPPYEAVESRQSADPSRAEIEDLPPIFTGAIRPSAGAPDLILRAERDHRLHPVAGVAEGVGAAAVDDEDDRLDGAARLFDGLRCAGNLVAGRADVLDPR